MHNHISHVLEPVHILLAKGTIFLAGIHIFFAKGHLLMANVHLANALQVLIFVVIPYHGKGTPCLGKGNDFCIHFLYEK